MVAAKPRPITDSDELFRDFGERLLNLADFPNINNATLHLKQQVFHESLDHLRIFQAGNQAGKSFVGYFEDAKWATNTHEHNPRANAGPQHGRIIVPDFTKGEYQIAIPNLSRLIPPSYLKDGSWDRSYSKSEHLLTLSNGSTIEIMSQEQEVDAFAGTQRDFVHADEECEKERWDESMVRLIRRHGYAWVTQTPVAGVEWIFDDYIKPLTEGVAGTGRYEGTYRNDANDVTRGALLVTASIWDNAVSRGGALPDEAIEQVLSRLSPEDRRVREFGTMPEMGGSAFPEFKRSTHVIEHTDPRLDRGQLVIPDSARIYTTMDDGRVNPTAWLWVAAMNDGTMVTFQEHYKAGWDIKDHVAEVKRREDELGRPIFMRVGDPKIKAVDTRGTSILIEYAREMRRLGMSMPGISVNSIPQDRRIHRAKVHQYFQINPLTGRAFWEVLYLCPKTIEEISGLKNDGWQNRQVAKRNNKKEGIRDVKNHTYDATKYLASIMADITPERLEQLHAEAGQRMAGLFEREYHPVDMASNSSVMLGGDEDRPDDDWMYRSYDED
jgi:hypothetical protein